MSRSIWAFIAFSFLMPVFLYILFYDPEEYAAAEVIRLFVIYGSLFCAVYNALFTGRSITDRTIKNMVVTGAKKTSVYLAEVLTSLLFTLSSFLIYTGMTLILFKNYGRNEILYSASAVVLWLLFFSAFYVLINTNFSSKIFAVFLSMVFVFVLMSLGSSMESMLDEPVNTVSLIDGVEISQKNPRYISGVKRDICSFLFDSNPYALEEYSPVKSNIIKTAELTLPLTFISVLGGTIFFGRKELD